uniref:Agrin n=1 Tax=Scleropages formosus TaxID=113540 RepID=A0A8C9VEY1_SCLFO
MGSQPRRRGDRVHGWLVLAAAVVLLHGASCRGSCPEKELERREEEANIVLTGTVEEIMNMDPVHNTYSCKVRVWRYLKGKSLVNGEVLLDGGNKVMIGGFGDPGICDNQVATGDTRIFFVNLAPEYMWPAHRNELMLNSSLMRITLRNLEEVENCVEDKPGHFSLAQAPDGCRGMLCGFGALCERDPADPSKGHCMCKKTTCPTVVAPVCGSDSSTYSNECELEKAQCNAQRRIKVVRKGPCVSLKDPCGEVTCSYGSTCVLSSDGQSAKCMCPVSCEGQPRHVVCGSDGNDYPSECELNKQACAKQTNIRKQYQGPCDPCSHNNMSGACRVEPGTRRMVTLPSPDSCPLDSNPLCASDGQTYSSDCQMRRVGLLKGITLRKVHSGPCKNKGKCSEACPFNSVCLVEQLGPRCSCEPIECDGAYKPLCGKDGNTYANDCERQRAECIAKAHIPVKHQGPCDMLAPSPCRGQRCDWGGVCVVKDGGPVCECLDTCPSQRDPVCGSDGQTYGSQCQMKAMACTLQKEIHIKHKGPCEESCSNCSFGAICDGQTGRCVCSTECEDSHQPVCGTDGITYATECHLHVRACTEQLDLKVAAQGECKACGGGVCKWGARCMGNRCQCQPCAVQPFAPVCGSNGITYENTCELLHASCVLKKKIEVARMGSCDEDCGSGGSGSGADSSCEQDRCKTFGGSWDEDAEEDRCVCDFTCHSVCGSDGRNYSNECELKKTRCEKQVNLQIQSQGPYRCAPIPPLPPLLAQTPTGTVYGCCLDGYSVALGVGLAGCPSTCNCNQYGSYGGTCDPTSGQCSCKPGVGGLKCDRCKPGFWNFRGIATENTSGCTPCNCDTVGSVRDDCEQMSGLCSCKTGVKGLKCNMCPSGARMGVNGCDSGPNAPTSCSELTCKFGASCVELEGQAHCECPLPDCPEGNQIKVCGSDGVTYADRCQLRTIACRQDKNITVAHEGHYTILHLGPAVRNTPSPATLPHVTPSTAHVKTTKPSPRHITTPGVPPDGAVDGPGTLPIPTLPPTVHQQLPHTTPPGPSHTNSPAPYEDSGSGEPSGDDEEEASGILETSGDESPTVAPTLPPPVEERSSCDNSPYGCCPDGRTAASSSEGPNCPPTMKYSGSLHLEQVEGQELFYTPEMEDPKSELFGETARSIESALNELFRKSDVQKDFKSVRVRNLAPSNSILVFVEAHFDPDTRFSVEDVQGALLKQLKKTKETSIMVKKPVEENIHFNNYGLSTLPFFTTTTTTTVTTPIASMTTPITSITTPAITSTVPWTTRQPTVTTRQHYPSRRTTTPSPVTTPHAPTMTTTSTAPPPAITKPHRPKQLPKSKLIHPCESHPCLHGGTCEDDGEDFTCICPAGKGGTVCEKGGLPVSMPSPGQVSVSRVATEIVLHIITMFLHHCTSCFLCNGMCYVCVSRFNTGSGTGSVMSRVRVKPGRWHQLVVTRNRRNAILRVDGEPQVEGESPPGTDGLNLDTDLFIGGVPEDLLQDVKERTSVSSGFVGCVRTLDVNNMVYNLQEKAGHVLYGSNVGECGNNPCVPNPCRNGATCQVKEAEMFHCKCAGQFSGPTCADAHNPCDPNKCHPSSRCQVQPMGGYKCECPMGREGTHCEKESKGDKKEAFLPFFSGNSYLELKGLQDYGIDLQEKVNITVVFLANDSNGMIFYNGQKTDGKGDFISLSLNDGVLEFRYDLGRGPAVIRSKEKVKMNVWNTVSLVRTNRKGNITVNNKDTVKGEAPDGHSSLNLKETLFVGGAPDFSKLARAAALKDGFKGAVQKITLMGTPILSRANALRSSDVSMYSHHPCAQNVCQNGGLCLPLLERYECICQHGFSGTQCQNAIYEKSAGETESIAFDGKTFIEYHNAVTKSEKALLVNKFDLSIRTEATQGLILWSGKGTERSDYIALAIVDGRVQMTYDLGSKPVVLQSTVRVNTNRWIRIKASRAMRDGFLQVGNEAPITGSSPLAATQLDTDGALWLGGLEELAVARRLPKAYSTGFVGCVKDVSVDGVELHLVEDALNSPRILHCSTQ